MNTLTIPSTLVVNAVGGRIQLASKDVVTWNGPRDGGEVEVFYVNGEIVRRALVLTYIIAAVAKANSQNKAAAILGRES